MVSPKTVLDKIIYSIRQQPATSSSGVSRINIIKYLKAELDYDNKKAISKALKQGVQTNQLVQTGQSFKVKGDPEPQFEEVTVKIEDVKEGSLPEAEKGSTVVVKYKGTLQDQTVFDQATSFQCTLGAGEVIKGWDQGIVGMKVGGVRKLHVPSKLAYGKRGSPPEIPPNADLDFVITLQAVL